MTGGSVGPQASPDHLAWICAPPHSRSFSISTNGSRESGKIVDIRRNAPNVKVPIRGRLHGSYPETVFEVWGNAERRVLLP